MAKSKQKKWKLGKTVKVVPTKNRDARSLGMRYSVKSGSQIVWIADTKKEANRVAKIFRENKKR